MARANNLPSEWMRIASKHRRLVPKGSPFSAFQRAMKGASAEYHGRTVRSNPGTSLGQLIVYGGIAYGLYWVLSQKKT